MGGVGGLWDESPKYVFGARGLIFFWNYFFSGFILSALIKEKTDVVKLGLTRLKTIQPMDLRKKSLKSLVFEETY